MKNLKHTLLAAITVISTIAVSAQNASIYLHKAEVSTISGYVSTIDDDQFNNKVFLYPIVTHNFNPGWTGGKYQKNNTGMMYYSKKWKVFDETKGDFAASSSYNILMPGEQMSVWPHKTDANNTSSHISVLDNPIINGDANAMILVTHLYNLDGSAGTYHPHNVGVYYNWVSKKWQIFNQDKSKMPENVYFTIAVVKKAANYAQMVHGASPDNTTGHVSIVDHEDLNNNPDAKFVITSNWNPNGAITGVYNDHVTGVFYNGSKWAIYNEDLQPMDSGAAFNVVIINDEPASNKQTKMEIPSLRIGPNPVVQGTNVKIGMFNENNENLSIELIDINGRIMFRKEILGTRVVVESLETAGLAKGMYSLKINGTSVSAVRRIIIQ